MNFLTVSSLLVSVDLYIYLLVALVAAALLCCVIGLIIPKKKPKAKNTDGDGAEQKLAPVEETNSEKEETDVEPVQTISSVLVEAEPVTADEEQVPTVKQILGDNEDDSSINEPIKELKPEISAEQILSEAEAEPEEEVEFEEALPDEDEPQEEVRSVDKQTGMAIIVRYKKSFTAKYIQSDDKTKAYYSLLKNEILSYRNVKNRVSWNHENFNSGRNNIARFSIRGKSLCMYLALDPKEYEGSKYKVEYAESKKYENIPCMYRVRNARRAKYALELIAAVAEKYGLEKGEQQNENYYQHYETTKFLIDIGLIKELVSEENYNEFMRQYSRKEVDRKRRQFVSAKEVNEVITDDVAIALVEDKRASRTKTVNGKKGIVNVDTLSENYMKDETVTLENLKEKGLIAKNVGSVKVLARGTLTKPLIVEAQDFSIEAVKMIVLTGGKATKV